VGSDAEVFVFDHARYVDEVVPAIIDLVRTAAIAAPWLAWFAAYDPEGMAMLRQHRVDLQEHCIFLGTDLRYLGDGHGPSQQFCGWTACPVRDRCPLHAISAEAPDRTATDVVQSAFAAAVKLRCLGPSMFLGRTYRPSRYLSVFERLGAPADRRLRELVDSLALRAFTLRENIGLYEGINGWLTVDETVELAVYLDELPLPRDEASFERMKVLQREFRYRPGEDEVAEQHRWEELSLSFLRTAAFIAADRGKGILWAHDVTVEFTQKDAVRYERLRLRADGVAGTG
jgi:hypothetical protein